MPSIQGISVGPDPGPDPGDNTFTYYYLAPDVSMVLDLDTPGGDYAVPLVTAGAFDGPDFSFGYTGTEGCTGVVTCEPGAVALAPGATISGRVDGSAEFSNAAAVPEPSSLVLLSTLVLAVALIARKSWAHRPATRNVRSDFPCVTVPQPNADSRRPAGSPPAGRLRSAPQALAAAGEHVVSSTTGTCRD